MFQTNVSNGQEVWQFYHCLAFARFWKVKFWRSFIKCQYFNDGWTDFHKKRYIFISLVSWAFFENRKNSGLTPGQNDDSVTRTWKMTQMTHWPNDPVPCLDASTRRWPALAQRRAGKKVICCIVAFEAVVIYFAEWPRVIATKLVVIFKWLNAINDSLYTALEESLSNDPLLCRMGHKTLIGLINQVEVRCRS